MKLPAAENESVLRVEERRQQDKSGGRGSEGDLLRLIISITQAIVVAIPLSAVHKHKIV